MRKRPGKMVKEVLKHVAAAPATVRYPFVPAVSPPHFRGKIRFFWEKCIGCKLCEKDCPTDAIRIDKVAEKRFEATFFLDKCIYCAQCVDTCPKGALESTPAFELAALERKRLEESYHAPLPTPEELAREAEAKAKAAEAKAAAAAKAAEEKKAAGEKRPQPSSGDPQKKPQ